MDDLRLEYIENQIKDLEETIKKAKETLSELRKKRFKLVVENKAYMPDLTDYIGKEIVSVCFVLDNDKIMSRYNDGGLLYADYKGRLVYNSEIGGSIRYEDAFNSYVLSRNNYSELLNIVGFFDVEIED